MNSGQEVRDRVDMMDMMDMMDMRSQIGSMNFFPQNWLKPGKLDLDNVSESRRPLFVRNTNLVLFTFL